MKLDMDLARAILREMEDHPHGFAPPKIHVEGYSDEQIGYHIYSLGEAGLLKTSDVTSMASPSPYAIPVSMTWAGHQFLMAARNDSIWRKAVSSMTKAGLSLSFELLKSELLRIGAQHLGTASSAGN